MTSLAAPGSSATVVWPGPTMNSGSVPEAAGATRRATNGALHGGLRFVRDVAVGVGNRNRALVAGGSLVVRDLAQQIQYSSVAVVVRGGGASEAAGPHAGCAVQARRSPGRSHRPASSVGRPARRPLLSGGRCRQRSRPFRPPRRHIPVLAARAAARTNRRKPAETRPACGGWHWPARRQRLIAGFLPSARLLIARVAP